MKFIRLALWIFVLGMGISQAQENMSKADVLFFEYSYNAAIRQYHKERVKVPLTKQQNLNLADAYLKIGHFKDAVDTYMDIYKKDTTMSSHYFNKMLQAMARTSGMDGVKSFLKTKKNFLTKELMENADFNFELIESSIAALNFETFNVDGNSPQADFSPTFYRDKILFTSARALNSKDIYAPSGESYLDIYEARVDINGNIIDPTPFSGIPNSPFHKATPYYSEELGQILYILSNAEEGNLVFDENGKNALAIGAMEVGGDFRYLLRDLSRSFYYPFYDASSSKLYFTANFDDSLGGTDIYYVYTNDGQIMSAPINLGPTINTPGNEIAPFIFEGSFYYSSDIFYGLGGMDVYKSEMQADGFFSIPINLGKSINSTYDEFGFIIKNDGTEGLIGYFSSNRNGGKGNDDIYGFKVAEKPGLKTFTLRGKIVNLMTNNGIPDAQVRLLNREGATIKEAFADENGDYRIEVPWQEQITVESTKERHSIFSDTYGEEDMERIQKGLFNMGLKFLDDLVEEKENQTVLKLKKFYFSSGSDEINMDIAAELDKVIDAVLRFPQLQLRIESHTDSRGGSAANFRISQKRADAIKNYLEANGVPSANILYSVGYGEDRIINNCTNGVFCLDMLHQQNERHLIVVLNYNLL